MYVSTPSVDQRESSGSLVPTSSAIAISSNDSRILNLLTPQQYIPGTVAEVSNAASSITSSFARFTRFRYFCVYVGA